jgi:ATP phosphoribosyltransferase
MNARSLVIALPSKGRIEEGAREYFSRVGLPIRKSAAARDYAGGLTGLPDAEVLFLAASEIPAALEEGRAHLGITGEDIIRERAADPARNIALIEPLGFSRADVVVAVPSAWIDVASMADLDEVAHEFRARHHRHLRVATKYFRLTRGFFALHGLIDYRIVESAGATEGAPASGLAEIIVDITTTGATLAANSLKVLSDGVILKSQAQLAASLRADWSPVARRAASRLIEVIWTADRDQFALVTFAQAKNGKSLVAAIASAFGDEVELRPQAGRAQQLVCPQRLLNPVYAVLRAAGVTGDIKSESARVSPGDNRLLKNLLAHLGRG